MRAVDVIDKKRRGLALSKQELQALMDGYLKGDVPDYQMSAFLMAVVWRGMTTQEMADFTQLMASSGDELDLRGIPGMKVDKHSTGGVGDKTTLILGPLLASIGVPVAKMSGRGLGHTGGTIDKLESIPGFQTSLTTQAFIDQVTQIGVAVAGQSGDLAPADKRIYALRDVTATVESIPLIASSIMSKKLASGANAIVLDVKVGSGAFMKTEGDARRLARTMVGIGNRAGRQTVAVLSSMEEPLGRAIGNALEVKEAIATLMHRGPDDLTEVCLTLGAEMAVLAGAAKSPEEAREMLIQALDDGSALAKFKQFVAAQGGDPSIVDEPDKLPTAPVVQQLRANRGGYVSSLEALPFGEAAMRLGAGRATKEDVINPAVGVVVQVSVGQRVEAGDVLVEVHADSESAASACLLELTDTVVLSETPVERPKLILGYVRNGDDDGDEELLQAALQAREKAYVPYSGFAVGAALRTADGRIVTGANIENASFGLTNCAERSAVFSLMSARTEPDVAIAGVAVVADSPDPVAPCGACRQVLAEFCSPNTPVLLANLHHDIKKTTVGELLPGAFTPEQMAYAQPDSER
ncbi:pyrimidine-nucleoside phosphorylase [Alicyclobacillus fastidiosus]|uniref:Cytidine deaminase n=1 Tax=Alicyclobacillus fastidiosus TaxID=392011 RepID=A0ABV5AHQ9_9BACL|nr:pyrimidine-nucleoside phosphorylase [Alicyclobacillus fastidiosus]WEH09141.1 pyrimidine-nucleoside phosphorylase [Alicyclobacillus fastidiosus]